jgi:hypothetical protein
MTEIQRKAVCDGMRQSSYGFTSVPGLKKGPDKKERLFTLYPGFLAFFSLNPVQPGTEKTLETFESPVVSEGRFFALHSLPGKAFDSYETKGKKHD